MYDVSLVLLFESVNKVLTTVLGNLYIEIFSGEVKIVSLIGSSPNSVVPSSSNLKYYRLHLQD